MRKFERNEPYFAVQWFLGRLIPQQEIFDNITFSVYIRKMHKQRGICWAYEKYPLEYTVVIASDMGRRDSLRALAHEAVHISQYATGKMQDVWHGEMRGKILWKNQMMDNVDTGSRYYNTPWEKEAYAKQDRLMSAYLAERKKMTD